MKICSLLFLYEFAYVLDRKVTGLSKLKYDPLIIKVGTQTLLTLFLGVEGV